jgi:hypothetical protein
VADNNDDILTQFQEFLAAKQASENEEKEAEDFEVEIFKGDQGVRTRRSHAKPFLQQLGIDLDPEPTEPKDPKTDGAKGKQSTGKQAASTAATGNAGVAARYFKQTGAPKP